MHSPNDAVHKTVSSNEQSSLQVNCRGLENWIEGKDIEGMQGFFNSNLILYVYQVISHVLFIAIVVI